MSEREYGKLREVIMPPQMKSQLAALASVQHAGSLRIFEFRSGDDTVCAHLSRSTAGTLPDGKSDLRWHISVSIKGQHRLPDWDEMKMARRLIKPGVHFLLPFPQEKYWMNYGEILHLTESKDENLNAHWEYEGEQARQAEKRGMGYGSTLEDALNAGIRKGKRG